MKLTLRSLQSRKTQILDVPEDCSIRELKEFQVPDDCSTYQLKELLSHRLSSSSSSLRLSFNQKDELLSQSLGDSLLSAGDTIYYDLSHSQQGNAQSILAGSVVSGSNLDFGQKSDVELLGNRANGKGISIEDEKLELGNSMDVECGWDCKGSYELYFLKKVLCEKIGIDLSDAELVFLAVHAVFLESGFVGFDPVSGFRVDFFDILKEQSSMSFPLTVSYTHPDLLSSDKDTESIVLRFQTSKHYVNVNGSLARSLERMHKLSIHNSILVPAIGHLRENADIHGRLNDKDPTKAYTERVILEFWKSAKDDLALHLMIELCEETGLALPPCFMRLPDDLKFRILELLSGRDTARVACVCKELNNLSSLDELWKGKYLSEHGGWLKARDGPGPRDDGNWKVRFLSCRERKRKRLEIDDAKMLKKLEARDRPGASGDYMNVDCGWDCKGSYELYFLKKVLCEKIGTDLSDTKLVFLAVHAVFLEFGFVGFNPVSGFRVDFSDILKEQSSMSFPLTVSYTLPALLCNDEFTESIVLRFQTLKHHVNVFGSLACSPQRMHKLSIHDSIFVPAIGHFRENADINGRLNEEDPTKAYTERVILEFWKNAKDDLALHLMMELCEKTGRDTARVACFCKKLCKSANGE